MRRAEQRGDATMFGSATGVVPPAPQVLKATCGSAEEVLEIAVGTAFKPATASVLSLFP